MTRAGYLEYLLLQVQEDFKKMVHEEWDRITIDEINDLINSIMSRVKDLITTKGERDDSTPPRGALW